jgi:hypothetical protein
MTEKVERLEFGFASDATSVASSTSLIASSSANASRADLSSSFSNVPVRSSLP